MPQKYGIDTSVLVRLMTGQPEATYRLCVEALRRLVIDAGSQVVVSNQVIGEAYIAVQHHYRVSEPDARDALIQLFEDGLIHPLNGQSVLSAIETSGGPGLLDRLIADGYRQGGFETLTLDRKMSNLPGARAL